ncbi:MAG: hypothetical protein CSA58_05310 [Micrococcales bacterium]|nr:MAG: hypothetical protein CSA58_05310 [Micrococcales bacterium]
MAVLSALMVVVGDRAYAAASLVVDSWSRDGLSGDVEYDLSVAASQSGVCATSCTLLVEAGYLREDGTWAITRLADIDRSPRSDPWSFTWKIADNSDSLVVKNATHVRASELNSATREDGAWMEVAPPAPGPSAGVEVGSFDRVSGTGKADYDLVARYRNLRADPGGCSDSCAVKFVLGHKDAAGVWQIDRDFTTTTAWHTQQRWFIDHRVTGSSETVGSATHARAYVEDNASGDVIADSAWVDLGSPLTGPSSTVTVNSFDREPGTGEADYDLVAHYRNLRVDPGGCSRSCTVKLVLGHKDSAGVWRVDRDFTGTTSWQTQRAWFIDYPVKGHGQGVGSATHARAYVVDNTTKEIVSDSSWVSLNSDVGRPSASVDVRSFVRKTGTDVADVDITATFDNLRADPHGCEDRCRVWFVLGHRGAAGQWKTDRNYTYLTSWKSFTGWQATVPVKEPEGKVFSGTHLRAYAEDIDSGDVVADSGWIEVQPPGDPYAIVAASQYTKDIGTRRVSYDLHAYIGNLGKDPGSNCQSCNVYFVAGHRKADGTWRTDYSFAQSTSFSRWYWESAPKKTGVDAGNIFRATHIRAYAVDRYDRSAVVADSGWTPIDDLVSDTTGGSNAAENCVQACTGDPVNTYTGEFFETATDLVVGGSPMQIPWSRHYATTRAGVQGPLGYGWRSGWESRLESATGDPLGTAQAVRIVQENGSTAVFHRQSDGSWSAAQRVLADLESVQGGGFRFTRRQQDVFVFDTEGQLTQVQDRNGNAITLSYNDAGDLATVSDGKGASLTVTWAGGRVSKVTDHSGRSISYAYTNGNLTTVTAVDGTKSQYTYDSSRRITTMTDAAGRDVVNEYDTEDRVVRQTMPGDRVMTWKYGQDSTTVTAADGLVTRYDYDADRLVKTTLAPGTDLEAVTTYEYDATNSLTKVVDPLGRSMSMVNDAKGHPVRVTDPTGTVTTATYDPAGGRMATVTVPGVSMPSIDYDATGNPTTITTGSGASQKLTYTEDGHVKAMTDPLGRTVRFSYDDQGRVVSIDRGDGVTGRVSYDALARVVASTDARGTAPGADPDAFTTRTSYDPAGRVLKITSPTGGETSFSYDVLGRVSSVTDADKRVTKYAYTQAGFLASVTDPAGGVTTYTYDKQGRPLSVTDPASAVTRYSYDALGRPTTVTDPTGRVTTTAYDAAGQITSVTVPSGAVTTYERDVLGRVVKVSDPAGGVSTTAYDAAGRVTTVTDALGRSATPTYDEDGRIVSVRRADGSSVAWAYDAAGQLTTLHRRRRPGNLLRVRRCGPIDLPHRPVGHRALRL